MPLITAIVPAAGVGKRMQAACPKQYLRLGEQTVLEHTVAALFAHPKVDKVVIAISADDPYFDSLPLAHHPKVICVHGGKERADSVLNALRLVSQAKLSHWVMVHDAARPCITQSDITRLIAGATEHSVGAILASPVRDTMKRGDAGNRIVHTVEREALWHALTPQMFPVERLLTALEKALAEQATVTDEASALEWVGLKPALVCGRADNIKITQPEDLALAEFYLNRNKETR
ncbi:MULTISPECIES: 2-C-methyl-D-erythritol 4-phosphate cytidylyltransferase [unclassified Vibrio]|uniref:2-C-methyl-D-erythritol 4-phosphate cytidylyltransferase n=1 Tax=unclassified Vibrio TaxID=2614977 RepID=UPI00137375E6|nr:MULTISPECIES: 2-C-methyl-D-erythritol 4-phosphate cytidylyltransferase [unclassified Vibrio]NAW69957.1 2-C-methyl-D-erythritol 4-phosphate cytidylyltransferase [Vibrio sp. V28_P6S34P95]NAX05367.1 2-C-methyl-D-erythritol 4-phosphate cytidylyltransferase [Vibrio sp. V30_P3S12P165]NAX33855.1 2-C-methyl-D-erythritol 4-phosphate cytidylyltransferase [Vibrio sp. V29_P1S30P107]NAX37032.1 2-C-methyl-D-erythritol 4-phosphate cytidylyltransferase [Vibrio sp. V27_P1S3P104]NAX39741.1 2-C-methyl-D-eryth